MDETPNYNQSAEFVSLMTEHQSDLWAFILAQLPGSPDVADILQKTNLTLWTKQDQFELGTNFKAWAFSVARFEVLTHLKKAKRGNWLCFREDLSETIAEESGSTFDGQSAKLEQLDHCISKLKPADQDLLRHRYLSKEGLQAYSETSGRSISALSVSLYRVRSVLRECIQRGLKAKGGLA
ncbi:sigma-70 family RNA polymerase sigma factor [Rubritalea tangerina]|uniref:Sigma-70 family RNA polymerase sigma factor n=1 Tax=Rubritalea tangerina TaxID=430798 RepID=A0ABW4ZCT4_9BACT